MEGKEIKGRTRIGCPLCGSLGWQSQFDKEKPLLKLVTQWSPGFRQIKYQKNTNSGMLHELHAFLIDKVEALYLRLTGIDIQKLIGGDNREWEKSKSVSTVPVRTTEWLKVENLSNKENPSVIPTGSLRKVLTKNLTR